MTPSSNPHPRILASSAGRGWMHLDAAFVEIPRGLARVQAPAQHVLGMHFGPPVKADCSCDGLRLKRIQRPGDIGFVPAGAESTWEDDRSCRLLRLGLSATLVDSVATELGRNPATLDLLPQLQLRDARLEAIGWAIKADLEADDPSDPLYIEHLTHALAVRVIETTTAPRPRPDAERAPTMSRRQLALLVEYIEANLHQKLHLADLASIAGMSVTRFKMVFRNSTGMPVHQYVLRRRIECARAMIASTRMPISEVALAVGFAHQSHMATTMRRILGHTPGVIARP
ncbi:AraC family transcriptional regulator [Bacillus sp. NP157]|nr:AraC family transcriptional regulator [Bacillus sp. NP157]